MHAFAALYSRLDATTKTTGKLAALRDYFAAAAPEDAAWALFFLCGHRPKQPVPTKQLTRWAAELSAMPDWLFEECYSTVGDLAETIALLLPISHGESSLPFHQWIEQRLLPIRSADEARKRELLAAAWSDLDANARFVWNKLLTGGFRVGVSQQLVVRALAEVAGLEPSVIAGRLMGTWQPTPEFYRTLIDQQGAASDPSQPYPFGLAHPLEGDAAELGSVDQWQAEWKWDGIRAQLIRRDGRTFLWSRGEELIGERFPELLPDAERLPDGVVLDGEVLAMKDGLILPFTELQRRIQRKTVGKKLLADVPAVFLAFDLLERNSLDWRGRPLAERRAELEHVLMENAECGLRSAESKACEGQPPVPSPPSSGERVRVRAAFDSTSTSSSPVQRLLLSPLVAAASWEELAAARQASRERQVEGLMLKRKASTYGVGRLRGDWWKWKIEPYTVDAVLIYAQAGHGRRASLFTDYTFAVWDGGQLVPFAKAYSGLTDDEIVQVDKFIRENTVEKFGPVRSVTPKLVFELAFESLQPSKRHKSGIAVRFPRILRWRTDKTHEQADTLEAIKALVVPKTGERPA